MVTFGVGANQFLHQLIIAVQGIHIAGPPPQQSIFSISRSHILLSRLPVNDEINGVDGGQRCVLRLINGWIFNDFLQFIICKDQIFKAGKDFLFICLNCHNRLFGRSLLMPHARRLPPIDDQSALIFFQQIEGFEMKICVLALEFSGLQFPGHPSGSYRAYPEQQHLLYSRNPAYRESLVAYKGHPIIVPFAESRFLMTGIFIYHICFITLSKSTICQCMTN